MEYDRYEVDRELTKENYSIFDTSEERYIAENLKKLDAELIALALNKSN
ncbi:hypothetical protein [Paenibacillus ferrarius]|nr:hypothetical protein [Paenibacillus ferrarius]